MGTIDGIAGPPAVTRAGVSSFTFPVSSEQWLPRGPISHALPGGKAIRFTPSFPPFRFAEGWGTQSLISRFAKGWSTRPTRCGLWVVLLGPDGAGKSSVIEGLGSGVSAGFAGCERFHLRPALARRKQTENPNRNPHGQTARGTLISVFKLIYLLAANWLSYVAVVRPRVARGMLVLFDRYFPDCVVDAKRYRLPASCRRLTELVAALVPQPDLCVVLDAPASTLQDRKPEVAPAESEQQQKDYARLAMTLPNASVVNATRPFAEVLDEVVDRIIEQRLVNRERLYRLA